jgi:hypothetical protein
MEIPQYTLKPNTNRMVIPWIFKLLCLSALFYGGIYFNARYALKTEIPAYINVLIFVVLLILIVTQLILYNVRFGKYRYMFYTNRVEYEAKKTSTFLFDEYSASTLRQKMLNTGSIQITKTFSIGPISNAAQIKTYLDQLVQYHKAAQERFRIQQQQAAMQQELSRQQQASAPAAGTSTSQSSQGGIRAQ